jgi:molybdate transport system substrate-binding protein
MMLLLKLFILLFLVSDLFAAKYGTVFAASNLRFVFPEMIEEFYKIYPEASIHIQYEGTGTLTKEILDGDNYDLFLAADMKYPDIVYKHKKAIEPPKVYIQGKLVLYLPHQLQQKFKNKKVCDILTQEDVHNVVIANNKLAPYGVASIEVLKKFQIYSQVQKKIDYSSDIATAVYKLLWNNEVGFVPKSALLFFGDQKTIGKNWIEVNQNAYKPILQGYVLSKNGKKNENVVKFLAFLFSKKGEKIFQKYGYIRPTKRSL